MRLSAWNYIGRLFAVGFLAVSAISLLSLISPDTSTAAVAPPNKMNFQGRLTDASGNPLSGTYDMQFKLYSAASGGTLLWAETRTAANANSVTVTSGLFSVRLGEGTLAAPSTQLSAVVAANATLYFEITIGSDAAMTPRSQLATSAYAFNSDALDGIDSTGFIQNTSTQQTADFNISGTGQASSLQASSSVLAPLFDAAGATVLNIGTTNATAINLNKNVTVAAGKTLTLAGGTTANRPASPTEGMLYYDTSTKQLVMYANGKWQSDRNSSTKIVAASNASQALKDGADYVATGSGDEATINTALAASAGGKVYLTEGTYTIYDSISVPNNTTLAGAGNGTVIMFPNGFALERSAIVNTDTATGTGLTIRDLNIDGNNGNISTGNGNGIYLVGVGSDTAGSVRPGAVITNVVINNLYNGPALASTVVLDNTYGSSVTDSTIGSGNIYIHGRHNTIANNYIFDSSQVGIYLDSADNNTVSGNIVQGTAMWGIYAYNSNYNTIAGNRISDTGDTNTNDAIYLSTSDSNTITGNIITDSSATTNNYAINIFDAASSSNYLADNTLGGGGINDASTSTVYGGQVDSADNYILQPAGDIALQAGIVTAGTGSGEAVLTVNGGSTGSKRLSFATAGSVAWSVGSIGTGATPSFNIQRWNSGAYVDSPLSISNTTGLVTVSSLQIGSVANQSISFTTGASNHGMEIGRTDGTTSTPFIDFHAGATVTDYDSRIIASGGTGASGRGVLNIATGTLTIGTSDTNASLLVLDTKTSAGDPSGTNGAMYYNSSDGTFRCYENGTWKDCITALPVSAVKTADQTISSTTPANVTNLAFSVAANTKYHYKFVVKFTASSTSAGIGFGVTTPASPTSSHWCAQTIATRNAATGGQWAGYCNTGDAAVGMSTYDAEATTDMYPTTIEGYLQTGASAGTLQLRSIYQEANVVIKAGSFGVLEVVQ